MTWRSWRSCPTRSASSGGACGLTWRHCSPPTLWSRAECSAARREWGQAGKCYSRALTRGSRDDGHFWFEYAALLLLSGDRQGYVKACERMAEKCGKVPNLRPYHVARACTLAPDALPDASLPGGLAKNELQDFAGQFWSLTEQGALQYRAGRFEEAVALFEQSLGAELEAGQCGGQLAVAGPGQSATRKGRGGAAMAGQGPGVARSVP